MARYPGGAPQPFYLVDSDIFDRASPRLVEALEKLADLIHPSARRYRHDCRPPDHP